MSCKIVGTKRLRLSEIIKSGNFNVEYNFGVIPTDFEQFIEVRIFKKLHNKYLYIK